MPRWLRALTNIMVQCNGSADPSPAKACRCGNILTSRWTFPMGAKIAETSFPLGRSQGQPDFGKGLLVPYRYVAKALVVCASDEVAQRYQCAHSSCRRPRSPPIVVPTASGCTHSLADVSAAIGYLFLRSQIRPRSSDIVALHDPPDLSLPNTGMFARRRQWRSNWRDLNCRFAFRYRRGW